jgi:hypothetical protein
MPVPVPLALLPLAEPLVLPLSLLAQPIAPAPRAAATASADN